MTRLIEDYALIGDCETAALVARDGSIDWLCFRASIGRLLRRAPRNARQWALAASRHGRSTRVQRRYRGDTLVLETSFEPTAAQSAVIDFMPPRTRHADLVRIVERHERPRPHGNGFVLSLRLRLGRPVGSRVGRRHRGHRRARHGCISGPPFALHGEDLPTVAHFTVAAGESVPSSLTCTRRTRPSRQPRRPEQRARRPSDWWAWASAAPTRASGTTPSCARSSRSRR